MFVRGDLTRLAQVIGNLLNNAAKYTPPGGHIRIEVERKGGQALVRVRDDGVGIAPEVLPRVFDMFTRIATPLDRSPGGLGIGLALVKQLVQLHGGSVDVSSPPPGATTGSEFTVSLPTVPAPEAGAPAPAPPPAVERPPSRLRILIADDNIDAGDSLAMLLETLGHQTHTARDGVEALEGATSLRPDVAFLDIGMPRLSGYEVCERIRAEPWGRSVVLVALTGWGQAEDRDRSSEAGFDHHLVKPAGLEALEQVLTGVRRA
jgi:CheY-like chemotaxis protein/anti-sigma regulatory factor (Ser/Thr protein kinase)